MPFKETDGFNDYADFWFYTIGANTILSDTINKTTKLRWAEYKDRSIEEEKREKTNKGGGYEKRIAVITGLLYREKYKGKHLACRISKISRKIQADITKFYYNHLEGIITIFDTAEFILLEQRGVAQRSNDKGGLK